eukprot:comp20987_c0_seq1/m.43937 comp20987_c0_seq1/g.43937  ORF comp20987_c0_seq1/g.43937 comp20987_c0_seq1/m.43937 type:complete len:553 (-) comp20987_c0_seq1:44-1702(-)
MSQVATRVFWAGDEKLASLDLLKASLAALPDWLNKRFDNLPAFDLLRVQYATTANAAWHPLESLGDWDLCIRAARALKGRDNLLMLIEERPREEPLLTQRYGMGKISRKWEKTQREYLRFHTRLTLDVERKTKVEMEAQLMQDIFVAEKEDETFVRICLKGIIPSLSISRIPINLVILIDRSASMKGAPLDAAKISALSAAQSLQAGDQLTVIAFDTLSTAIVPSFIKGEEEGKMKECETAIRKLEAGGSTNMQNALMMAALGAREAYSASKTNRVMLITDGKPNKVDGLVDIVQQLSQLGICTTTLGVGNDFDEELLAKLAQIGMGSHYWVKNGDQMIEVMKKEIADLALVVARQCKLILMPIEHVSVSEVYGYTYGMSPMGEIVVEIGDIVSNNLQDVLVKLSYTSGLHEGNQKLLDLRLTYLDNNTNEAVATSTLSATFSKASSEVNSSLPLGVVVEKVARVHAARAMKMALAKLRQGDVQGALRALSMESADLLSKKALSSPSQKARKGVAKAAGELEFIHDQVTRGQLEAAEMRKILAVRAAELEKS